VTTEVIPLRKRILLRKAGGITFRTTNANPYGYNFTLSQYGYSLYYSYGNPYGNPYGSNSQYIASSPTANTNLNQPHLLTAIVRGGTLSLYVDKQWVITVENSSASSGGIGLTAASSNDNQADVVFKNAEVWVL
jgi:hypothetical protein